MAPEFDLGRQYERQEVCALLNVLLTIEDNETLRQLLHTWMLEADASLPLTQIVTVDETYYVLAT